jgi:hypothetical protein
MRNAHVAGLSDEAVTEDEQPTTGEKKEKRKKKETNVAH